MDNAKKKRTSLWNRFQSFKFALDVALNCERDVENISSVWLDVPVFVFYKELLYRIVRH